MKEHLENCLHYLREEKRLSANTLLSYQRDLDRFLAFTQELHLGHPSEITRHHLARYMLCLKEEGKKAATVARHVVSIRAFFHYLALTAVLVHNPSAFMEAPKPEKSSPSIVSVPVTNLLLDAPSTGKPNGKRDKAMLELLYATGIRVSELVSLDVGHVHMQLGYIQCIGSGQKERLVPFGRLAKDALESYLLEGRPELSAGKEPDAALFLNHLGTRMTRQGFWKMIKKYAKEAGIDEAVTPHTLRHSVAVHMLEGGADPRTVQELLGHAELATTLKYVQLPKARIRDAYSSSHPRA
ncbi:tyrosine recombinase XerD [Paenibacillus sp. N4]|uniref:site-specific tyrosine recombinase n=1 Tax=Paenibacillus vietnamensis TaxID=2590547 RepID=UPI001CD14F7D|nr:site-specific tyrosine recombinase [Paenibacillus vietnamensis]MCA0754484.1 tyrosine recombinase XerD [Paenibacillus vietnamensis]